MTRIMLWGMVMFVAATLFVAGVYLGSLEAVLVGSNGVFISAAVPMMWEPFRREIQSVLPVLSENVMRDIACLAMIYGSLFGIVIWNGHEPWTRLALTGSAMLSISAGIWLAREDSLPDDQDALKSWNRQTIAVLGKVNIVLIAVAVLLPFAT